MPATAVGRATGSRTQVPVLQRAGDVEEIEVTESVAGVNPIIDYDVYNKAMRKSLIDKAFFLDKIETDLIVDFGCGDASLILLMNNLFPEITYVGYDNDPGMVDWAKNVTSGLENVLITDSWNEVSAFRAALVESIREELNHDLRDAVVCNSLIHEVYSYGDLPSIKEFWKQVTLSGFTNVVVRDMVAPSEVDPNTAELVDRDSDTPTWMVKKVRRECEKQGMSDMLEEFESIWGTIDVQINMTHFLMKYRYRENWPREVRENYFPVSIKHLNERIPYDWYDLVYSEHAPLPFNVRQIKKDFGFTFDQPTHYKLILEKRGALTGKEEPEWKTHLD